MSFGLIVFSAVLIAIILGTARISTIKRGSSLQQVGITALVWYFQTFAWAPVLFFHLVSSGWAAEPKDPHWTVSLVGPYTLIALVSLALCFFPSKDRLNVFLRWGMSLITAIAVIALLYRLAI